MRGKTNAGLVHTCDLATVTSEDKGRVSKVDNGVYMETEQL